MRENIDREEVRPMALRADVQYVRYRVDGTAARKIRSTEETVTPVYTRRKAERKVIAVDPIAIIGIALAAIVLIAMCVGLVRYQTCLRQSRQMSDYVNRLEQENAQLSQTYQDGYDPELIERIALEAGMIPAENTQKVTVSVEKPAPEQSEPSFWETLTTFLAGIFA